MIMVIFIDGIVSYMKKQAGPSSIALHSEAELDAFINGFDASVVGEFLSCYYPDCVIGEINKTIKVLTAMV